MTAKEDFMESMRLPLTADQVDTEWEKVGDEKPNIATGVNDPQVGEWVQELCLSDQGTNNLIHWLSLLNKESEIYFSSAIQHLSPEQLEFVYQHLGVDSEQFTTNAASSDLLATFKQTLQRGDESEIKNSWEQYQDDQQYKIWASPQLEPQLKQRGLQPRWYAAMDSALRSQDTNQIHQMWNSLKPEQQLSIWNEGGNWTENLQYYQIPQPSTQSAASEIIANQTSHGIVYLAMAKTEADREKLAYQRGDDSANKRIVAAIKRMRSIWGELTPQERVTVFYDPDYANEVQRGDLFLYDDDEELARNN